MRAKFLRRLAVTTGLTVALIAGSSTPVRAAVIGDGAVAGTVTVTPGVDLTTRATSFSFGATTITGAVAVRDNVTGNICVFAGSISVGTVTGGSPAENVISASGTVNGFNFSGSTTVGPITTTVSGSISGGFFVRVGPTVVVVLNLTTITVTNTPPGDSATTTGGTVVVLALFAPSAGQNGLSGSIPIDLEPPLADQDPIPEQTPPIPGGNLITNASFVGNFTVVGAP